MKGKKKYFLTYHQGIKKYLDEKRIPFHMPGHKGKFLKIGIEKNILPKHLFLYDITASYEREDLYNPKSFLKESLANITRIYHTKASYYLVNGSTGGNQAALLATLNPHDKILFPRNVHKLIYAALVATQAQPIYLESSYYQDNLLLSGIDPQKLMMALKRDPDIKVIYLVNPSYIGVCSNIKELIKIAHDFNKIIIVDEAHGAHFNFHPELPCSAVDAGADITIQSTHKTLNALSQTALLHLNGNRVSQARVEQAIAMLQTTSPNTVLLLSLEASVIQMANKGKALLERTLQLSRLIRVAIKKNDLLHCYDKEMLKYPHIFDFDETKIYLDVSSLGITGYAAKALLGKKYKIEAELADNKSLLFSLTIADNLSTTKKLIKALSMLVKIKRPRAVSEKMTVPLFPTSAQLTPAETFYSQQEDVIFNKSVGLICAEMVIPYPPGIPILMPGEIISKESVDYILFLIKIGASFSGTKYKNLEKIAVVAYDK